MLDPENLSMTAAPRNNPNPDSKSFRVVGVFTNVLVS
jgi:hypothetical protein